MDSLTSLLPLLPEIEKGNLSKADSDIIKANLNHPSVQKYFKVVLQTALLDLMENAATSEEGQKKLLARFLMLKGIQSVCSTIITEFGGKKA